METLTALQSLGLELPSPAYIVGAILFGIVGMAAYWLEIIAALPVLNFQRPP